MYCMHCGKKIDENLLICPHCGTAQNQVTKKDYGGIGWGILGYFVPMSGIILFFIWKNEKPKTAKALLIGAIIGFIVSTLIYVFSPSILKTLFAFFMKLNG